MNQVKSHKSVRSLFTSLSELKAQSDPRFVWLNNFEAEQFWVSRQSIQLPKFSEPMDVAIVNRLEEIGLFLAQHPDVLILREPSDQEYLGYLSDLGFDLPIILTANPIDKVTPISETILANDVLMNKLKALAVEEDSYYLLPYAKTVLEEAINSQTGLKSLGPSSTICEKVNSKIYSRRISKELSLRTVPGIECESIIALEKYVERFAGQINEQRSIVLKEAMGVSGKGLYVANSINKLQQIIKFIKRKAKFGDEVAFVIEEWIDKSKDINYQIFISSSGETRLLALKEIITQDGVHQGHRFPPDITAKQMACYEEAAELVGSRLFKDGFTGLAGIDSIIDREGNTYPVLEINARFNMSSYQLGLEWLIDPSSCILAKYYSLLLKSPISFSKLKSILGEYLFNPRRNNAGVLIQNFATVNVNFNINYDALFKGRLYVLIVGTSFEQIKQIEHGVSVKFERWQRA